MIEAYKYRCILNDLKKIDKTYELLHKQRFRDPPEPDITGVGLFFKCNEAPIPQIQTELDRMGWKCTPQFENKKPVYEYTMERTTPWLISTDLFASIFIMLGLILLIGSFISYKIIYQIEGKTWFTKESIPDSILSRLKL